MKKILSIILVIAILVGTVACTVSSNEDYHVHKIGVGVYDLNDGQVMAFREYLEQYIAANFDNVQFVYSQSITGADQQISFIKQCIEAGCEGFMGFNSYDLQAEVKLCADNKVYYVKPSSAITDEDYNAVKSNPYFVAAFGPDIDMEYNEGYKMGVHFADLGSKEFFILSGGASMGNAMHLERTVGILTALQNKLNVKYDKSVRELAKSAQPTTIKSGDVTITICSGYIAAEPFYSTAVQAYNDSPLNTVLSVIPIAGMANVIKGAKLGVIDCFTQENEDLFAQGRMNYVCGKYSSIIGPAFVALYNALEGDGASFRYTGYAPHFSQGFWVATTKEEYDTMFALSSGVVRNAYSFKDLLEVTKKFNSNASYNDLKALAEAYDFESALERTSK